MDTTTTDRAYKIYAFINEAFTLLRLRKLFHLKMMRTSCTDEVTVKIPSFQKVTLFYDIKYSTETLLVYVFVCLKMLLTIVI